jgi:hypothetical protein
MKKRIYIQPKMEVSVLPNDTLMGQIPVAGSPTGPVLNGGGAPKRVDPVRRTEVF